MACMSLAPSFLSLPLTWARSLTWAPRLTGAYQQVDANARGVKEQTSHAGHVLPQDLLHAREGGRRGGRRGEREVF